MSLDTTSKHYDAYMSHILSIKEATGTIAIVYNIIRDLSDRKGLRQGWEQIDGDIQDEIIDKWVKIIENTFCYYGI
jgi:hypothetical protein